MVARTRPGAPLPVVTFRALPRLVLRGGMAYAGSPSDGVLRVFVAAAADGDSAVASAARAGFACAARGARRAAVLVAVDALVAGRARAAAASGRCVADPTSLALLPLLSDVVRDAPPGALDDQLRAAVRAAALGARPPLRHPFCLAITLRRDCAASPRAARPVSRCSLASIRGADTSCPRAAELVATREEVPEWQGAALAALVAASATDAAAALRELCAAVAQAQYSSAGPHPLVRGGAGGARLRAANAAPRELRSVPARPRGPTATPARPARPRGAASCCCAAPAREVSVACVRLR